MDAEAGYLARLLAGSDSRSACLDELELLPAACAAAPLLRAMAEAEADHGEFQRMGVLLMRCSYDGGEDGAQPAAVIGAACAEGRVQAMYAAETVVSRALHGFTAAQLTVGDAISYCCMHCWQQPASQSGIDEQFAAASGLTTIPDIVGPRGLWNQLDPLCAARFTGDPAVPPRIAALVMELLHEPPGHRLPELARGGAAFGLVVLIGSGSPPQPHRSAVGRSMVESGIVELVVAEIEATQNAGLDWMSATDGMRAGSAAALMWTLGGSVLPTVLQTQPAEFVQGMRERFVSSGLFRLSLEAMAHFADRGTAAVADCHHQALYFLLKVPNFCRDEPGCEEQIRAHASAVAFCMDNNLIAIRSMHGTTAQATCQLAANVFGRDDESDLLVSVQSHHRLQIPGMLLTIACDTITVLRGAHRRADGFLGPDRECCGCSQDVSAVGRVPGRRSHVQIRRQQAQAACAPGVSSDANQRPAACGGTSSSASARGHAPVVPDDARGVSDATRRVPAGESRAAGESRRNGSAGGADGGEQTV